MVVSSDMDSDDARQAQDEFQTVQGNSRIECLTTYVGERYAPCQ